MRIYPSIEENTRMNVIPSIKPNHPSSYYVNGNPGTPPTLFGFEYLNRNPSRQLSYTIHTLGGGTFTGLLKALKP